MLIIENLPDGKTATIRIDGNDYIADSRIDPLFTCQDCDLQQKCHRFEYNNVITFCEITADQLGGPHNFKQGDNVDSR